MSVTEPKSVLEDLKRKEQDNSSRVINSANDEGKDSRQQQNFVKEASTSTVPSSSSSSSPQYPGDLIDETSPIRETGWQALPFDNPGLFVCYYNKDIREGLVTLHDWQASFLESIAAAKATAQKPEKFCLCTCNGSGKDAFIIASVVAWFAACKVRSRVIITSASGVQLTTQTEGYIRTLCQRVNDEHGEEIFKIRQRFITCRLSGSEIRLFATDEEGKAEGYHPLEPYSEMMIVVNEGKSVTEEIHNALRRCTGYNIWLEVSTPGEPYGFFHRAFTKWPQSKRVDYTMCPHVALSEVETDRMELGENSALFRSKWLALFTSIGGDVIIPQDLIESLLSPELRDYFSVTYPSFILRIGIDLAAGGDENVISFTKGNKCIKEVCFTEVDTEITADRIEHELKQFPVAKSYEYIYADDGGVGRSIIDKLVRKGWRINRVLNQHPALSKQQFGNRGAENWYRCKRIIEEKFFDVSTLSQKTREQLYTRHYKSSLKGARLFLESKGEARAEGRPSPDRADAFILSLTGVTVEDFFKATAVKILDARPKERFTSPEEVLEHFENNETYGRFNPKPSITLGRRIFNSLHSALHR